ncbi:sugar transporter SWEET1-like isoform X1 [Biomphalaria pfeifferi]|uniref:Sugar transporter SWEET1 n=1 Tax=Biomphalaria pfeifferi TaxID=112525 RepID=A0AAD8BSU3_BIOPF|nr:sugar transporter SWEET1-like isoform X1 [Biomphalaria pfeifferi]
MAVDLVTIVGWATILVTFVMMGSGIPACLRMLKNKTTENVPYALFLLFAFVGLLGFQYAMLIENKTLAFINLTSVMVWGAYASIYLYVTKQKTQAVKYFLVAVILYAAQYLYLNQFPQSEVTETLGFFMLICCLLLNILPAVDCVTILKEKSGDCCDLSMLLGGTLCAITWCLYGSLVKNFNIYFPSIPGLLISIVKLILVVYYGKSIKKID